MLISRKWLSDYVAVAADDQEFIHKMTMSGSKVEGFEPLYENVDKVVVGRVLSLERHPDSDHLWITQIEVGEEAPIQIVTGAQNLKVGDVVPVALAGSTLPGGKIKAGKLRGVASNGMLCSLSELNLTKNDFPNAIEDGIMVIDEPCELGQDIRDALQLRDTVVDFEITPNRPDCLSYLGIAREAAATFGVPLKLKKPEVLADDDEIAKHLSVTVKNPELCQRYTARMVKNVKIGPSPLWLRSRLRASGVRPINNIVDITNFVMLEYCQPMHAFDARDIAGSQIIVRNAQDGESFTTLDGGEHTLDSSMLVIADGERAVALAGVMGGLNSEVKPDTQTVIFESACFLGQNVRKTAQKLGLRTESSARFEKGLDPYNTLDAVNRACELVTLLGCGEVCGGIIDVQGNLPKPTVLKLDSEWVNRFLGTDLSRERMVEILRSLEFGVEEDGTIHVPTFRGDMLRECDIAEEIARIYGYNNIPSTLFCGGATTGGLSPVQKFEKSLCDNLLAMGLSEICTYTFISPKLYSKILMPEDSSYRKSVVISNPLGEETSIMRTTTLPSMMEVLARNYNFRNADVSLFEIGTVYLPKETPDQLPDEKKIVTLGLYGQVDYYDLKGIVEEILNCVGLRDYEIDAAKSAFSFHPGRTAELTLQGKWFGTLGELHPTVCKNYGIDVPVYAALLDFDTLFANRCAEKSYHPLPKYPAVSRDLALLCDDTLEVIKIEQEIRRGCGKLLESVSLFDVYRGKQIEEGKKSVAYTFTLRAADRTLTDEETEAVMKKVLSRLESIGCQLRTV